MEGSRGRGGLEHARVHRPALTQPHATARDDGVVVAYAEAGRGDRFRLPLLRALAAGFGAASTPDASSWMSESLPEGAPLRIDATNRALVLRNKATYPRTPAPSEPEASD